MAKIIPFPAPKSSPEEVQFDRVAGIISSKGAPLCPDCLGPAATPYQVHVTQGNRQWYELCSNEFHDDGPIAA